jgi:hypothetical protein
MDDGSLVVVVGPDLPQCAGRASPVASPTFSCSVFVTAENMQVGQNMQVGVDMLNRESHN